MYAEREKKWSPSVAALREMRSGIELLAEISGELRRYGSRVAVGVSVSSDASVKEFLALSDAERAVELAAMIANALEHDEAVASHVRDCATFRNLKSRSRSQQTPRQSRSLAC